MAALPVFQESASQPRIPLDLTWENTHVADIGAPPGLCLLAPLNLDTQALQEGQNLANRVGTQRSLEPFAGALQSVDSQRVVELTAGGLRSVGSAYHGIACQPCSWFWKPGGCQNGAQCFHCHMCPPGEVKNRKTFRKQCMQTSKLLDPQSFFRAYFGSIENVHSTPNYPFPRDFASTSNVDFPGYAAENHELEPLPLERIPSASTSASNDLDDFDDTSPTWSLLEEEIRDVVSSDVSGKDSHEDICAIEAQPKADAQINFVLGDKSSSVGAANHGVSCRPCAWFWKTAGCHHGRECLHCHACPQGELKSRRKVKVQILQAADIPKKRGAFAKGAHW